MRIKKFEQLNESIGQDKIKEFGNKDHSTIIYAVKRIEKDKEQKKSVAKDLNKLQTLLS